MRARTSLLDEPWEDRRDLVFTGVSTIFPPPRSPPTTQASPPPPHFYRHRTTTPRPLHHAARLAERAPRVRPRYRSRGAAPARRASPPAAAAPERTHTCRRPRRRRRVYRRSTRTRTRPARPGPRTCVHGSEGGRGSWSLSTPPLLPSSRHACRVSETRPRPRPRPRGRVERQRGYGRGGELTGACASAVVAPPTGSD